MLLLYFCLADIPKILVAILGFQTVGALTAMACIGLVWFVKRGPVSDLWKKPELPPLNPN